MTLWADADSLPPGVRELCARRHGKTLSDGTAIDVVFVSGRKIPLPSGYPEKGVIVSGGSADDHIMNEAKQGDILVTRDLPLADRAIKAGLMALNDRGMLWTAETVRERLSVRDQMAALRDSGLAAMPTASNFGKRELAAFANALEQAFQTAIKNLKTSRSG